MADIKVQIRITPGLFKSSLAALLLGAAATEIACESVTLTTYYPAPSGVYAKMITTGDTVLATQGGSVTIGTTNVPSSLTVKGLLTLGSFPDDAAASASVAPVNPADGSLYYNTASAEFRGYKAGVWGPLSSGGAPVYLPVPVILYAKAYNPTNLDAARCKPIHFPFWPSGPSAPAGLTTLPATVKALIIQAEGHTRQPQSDNITDISHIYIAPGPWPAYPRYTLLTLRATGDRMTANNQGVFPVVSGQQMEFSITGDLDYGFSEGCDVRVIGYYN